MITIGLSRTIYEISGDFSRKSPIFCHSRVFYAQAYGVRLELGTGAWSKKNWNDVATWSKKKFDDILNLLDTIYERDRQTNGQTPADSKDRANA